MQPDVAALCVIIFIVKFEFCLISSDWCPFRLKYGRSKLEELAAISLYLSNDWCRFHLKYGWSKLMNRPQLEEILTYDEVLCVAMQIQYITLLLLLLLLRLAGNSERYHLLVLDVFLNELKVY